MFYKNKLPEVTAISLILRLRGKFSPNIQGRRWTARYSRECDCSEAYRKARYVVTGASLPRYRRLVTSLRARNLVVYLEERRRRLSAQIKLKL